MPVIYIEICNKYIIKMTNYVNGLVFKVEVYESVGDYVHGNSTIIDKIYVPTMNIVFWHFQNKIICFKTTQEEIKDQIIESTDVQIPKHVIEDIIELINIDVRRKNIEHGIIDSVKSYTYSGEYKAHDD